MLINDRHIASSHAAAGYKVGRPHEHCGDMFSSCHQSPLTAMWPHLNRLSATQVAELDATEPARTKSVARLDCSE